jgi:fluoroacetyl-CoA thioesterase
MELIYKVGHQKSYCITVGEKDTASFDSGEVHPIYATFSLGRDAEWCCRLFVLDMKEDDEEGIGTFLNIQHVGAALIGSEVIFTATIIKIEGHEVICSFEAKVGDRLIARGEQGQKILKKEKLARLFNHLSSTND